MPRKRGNFQKRLESIKGLSKEEKITFRRIGEVIDSAVNNRATSNAEAVDSVTVKSDVKIPPPKNIQIKSGVRTSIITWNAVDSSILLNYGVQIENTETKAIEFNKPVYTNRVVFKGREGTQYKISIRTVGKNRVSSRSISTDFTMEDNVLILEGTKNGSTTFSSFVAETVKTPNNYYVTVFTSFVLDSLAIAGETLNPNVQLRIGSELSSSTLIEERRLFGKSESASSYNDSSFTPAISRPLFVNRSVLETTKSMIFSPYLITEDIADQDNTFWVVITSESSIDQIVSLSIVVWVAPQDQTVTDVGNVTHTKCINLPAGSRGLRNNTAAVDVWGIAYTVALWIKPLSLTQTGCFWGKRSRITAFNSVPTDDNQTLSEQRQDYARFGIGPLTAINDSDGAGNPDGVNFRHSPAVGNGLFFEAWPGNSSSSNPDGSPAGDIDELKYTRWIYNPLDTAGNTDYSQIWNLGIDRWYFLVGVCNTLAFAFNNTNRLKVYRNSFELGFTEYKVDITGSLQGSTLVALSADVRWEDIAYYNMGVLGEPGNHDINDAAGTSTPNTFELVNTYANAKIHKMGIWNRALTHAEIRTLYNSGNGADIDYRISQGVYSNNRLLAYEEFGRNPNFVTAGIGAQNLANPNFIVDIGAGVAAISDPNNLRAQAAVPATGNFNLIFDPAGAQPTSIIETDSPTEEDSFDI